MAANLAGVDAGDVSDLARRSMKQRAGFLACMCRDVLPERYLLKLFCLVIVVIFFLKDSYLSSQPFPRTTLPRKPEMIVSLCFSDFS